MICMTVVLYLSLAVRLFDQSFLYIELVYRSTEAVFLQLASVNV